MLVYSIQIQEGVPQYQRRVWMLFHGSSVGLLRLGEKICSGFRMSRRTNQYGVDKNGRLRATYSEESHDHRETVEARKFQLRKYL